MRNGAQVRRFHVVLSRPFDFATFEARAKADECPRHSMFELQKSLDATIVQPTGVRRSALDVFRSKFPGVGNADQWALAREWSRTLAEKDVVFAIGEDSGFPIATLIAEKRAKPRISVFVHNPDRPRVRYLFWRHRLRDRVELFVTNTEYKADLIRKMYGVPEERVYCIEEQTDTAFFRPGPAAAGKSRPVVGSGGLEQRDYATLAAATRELDVDVRICAVSPNAKAFADTFPTPMPDNMTVGRYDWRELRQLYRDSDIVVISLKAHNYQAGLTTLFEALACARPVIMTETEGLVERFARSGFLLAVPPADPHAMREAIMKLLDDPAAAREQAERGRAAVLRTHTNERYVADLADKLSRL